MVEPYSVQQAYQDFQWDSYKNRVRQAEWNQYAQIVSQVGSTLGGALQSYSNQGYVDVGQVSGGISNVLQTIGSYQGRAVYNPYGFAAPSGSVLAPDNSNPQNLPLTNPSLPTARPGAPGAVSLSTVAIIGLGIALTIVLI